MSTASYDLAGKRVWAAGHRGMVGSAVVRRLASEPIDNFITASSSEVDLRRQAETEDFVARTRPDVVIIAAAKVGGINANRTAQADFLYDNIMIAANVLGASGRNGVEKAVVLESSCIYPRDATQPLVEEALLTGQVEPTNEGYAIAKIAALEMAKMYRRQYRFDAISLTPTNLYGPGDNYDLATSHVLPALIHKIHDARRADTPTATLWGSGKPLREFLHVDDLSDAIVFATRNYSCEQHLNLGTETDITIGDLAMTIADVVGWSGSLEFDTSMPTGAPRKLLGVGKLRDLGWSAPIDLPEGIARTYRDYLLPTGGV